MAETTEQLIRVELHRTTLHIQSLLVDLRKAQDWRDRLTRTRMRTQPPRQRGRKRGPMSLAAERALIEMLRTSGLHIKQEEAVQRLESEYGIVINAKSPERRTSDLSATLRRIRGTPLRVSRRTGWSLAEWGNCKA